MRICMTNGGLYDHVIILNYEDITEENLSPLLDYIKQNEFIVIEHSFNRKAVIRTSCISSINL